MEQNNTLILQWNIRGLIRNYTPGLQPLINTLNPTIISLQETKLANNNFKINNYTAYNHINKNTLIAAGGTSLFIKNHIPQKEITINSKLQCIAVKISTFRPITICSIYIPPTENFNLKQLKDIEIQLPKPYIILGDFNAHSPLWEQENKNDIKGKIIEDLITQTNTILLNDKSPTYISPATLKTSSIDLTLCSPTLAPFLTWYTQEDTSFSDHYPIIIKNNIPTKTEIPNKLNFKKANWEYFRNQCKKELHLNSNNKTIESFTEKLLEITENSIPKLSTKPRKNKSWFNKTCAEAIKNKKRMLRIAKKNPNQENLKNFKIAQAKARQTCRTEKKESFKKYISKINNNTPMTKIWKIIRKLKGIDTNPIKHITKKDGTTAETESEIANEIAKSLSEKSSNKNYTEKFKKIKEEKEKENLDFSTTEEINYNQPFTITEIKTCLSELNETATGPDKINNIILSNLPSESISLILEIFNNLWKNEKFPQSWHKATIIPIPKPGKGHSNPDNYRPIALTSCLCKLMEKIISKRLTWHLEINNIISKTQCGYRKNRSTIDHLIRLETLIRNSFINKQHVTVIFFDIEKAFDTTWKHGIMKDLHNIGLRGQLPIFIENFLKDRIFQTKIGNTFSEWYPQEEGVPQGSILSPILFKIKINSITKTLNPNIESSLYVDDFTIAFASNSKINHTERILQHQINKLEIWANENGLKFSTNKTQIVHFCKKNSCIKTPEIFLYNNKIKVSDQASFLGVIFDKKLTFIPHIKNLKNKCINALNAFKVLCNPEWGGNVDILLNLYKSLILSKLDYACQIYGSARPSYLKMLNTIQNQGLRLALGAFRTSPETSLHAEAYILPLELRRQKLSLQYAIKLNTLPNNPAHSIVFKTPTNISKKISNNKNLIKPFSLRILDNLKEINFSENNTIKNLTPITPFWQLIKPNINLELTKLIKDKTNPTTYHKHFHEILYNQYKYHDKIYTDGSKNEKAVSSAYVPLNPKIPVQGQRIPSEATIFTAEANAINIAINDLNKSKNNQFVIITDSLSCLIALDSPKEKNPIILKLKQQIHNILSKNINISFLWIPSHVGITGNELADELAKNCLSNQKIKNIKIPYLDYKNTITKYFTKKWQIEWNKETSNKLHKIQPKLKKRSNQDLNRKENVIYTRIKIGHTQLTHSFLLKEENPPFCIRCNKNLTIKHILTECIEFKNQKEKLFKSNNLKTIIDLENPKKIINFLKETGLYNLI